MHITATSRCLAMAVATSSLALAACSALQIDVDVYKGPLINNEVVQKDQLISMALSAKTLLFTVRNNLMDEACKESVWVEPSGEQRSRVLETSEFVCKKDVVPLFAPQRTARRVNDILTFYDSKGNRFFRDDLDDLRDARDRYDELKALYLTKTPRNASRDQTRARDDYQLAHEARAKVWHSVVRVLRQSGREETQRNAPDEANRARMGAAQIIAASTQPLLLACAAAVTPEGTPWLTWFARANQESGSQLKLDRNDWRASRFRAAREGIERALEVDSSGGADALAAADEVLRRSDASILLNECAFAPSDTSIAYRAEQSGKAPTDTLLAFFPPSAHAAEWELLPKNYRKTGISQEPPTKPDVDADEREERRFIGLIANLATLGATGFDHGRVDDGIDRLADKYSLRRDELNRLAGAKDEEAARKAAKAAAGDAFSRLDHALVDLAGRMQFLATNAWLLGEMTTFDNNYKASLESIANNIIVHADDLRNRAAFDQEQTDSVPTEARAITAGFAPDVATSLGDIRAAIEADRKRALAFETAASASQSTPLDAAKKASTEAKEQADDARALALTLPGLADLKLSSDKESPAAIESDRKQLLAVLTGDGKPVDLETLRSNLAKWLDMKGVEFTSSAQKDDARGQRLTGAARTVASLKPLGTAGQDPLPRKDALTALASRARALLRRTDQQAHEKADAMSNAAAADKKAQERNAAAGELQFASADYTATAKIVEEAKGPALAQIAASGAAGDSNLVMAQLRLAVDAAGEKATPADKPRYEKASAVLRSIAGTTRIVPNPDAKSRIEVVDSVIAQLRYQHLDSIRRLGVDAAETRQLAMALAAARKEREDNVFLRPTSTYLRAANAATMFQTDPSLRWKNMLIENATETVRSLIDRQDKQKFDLVRADLDKTYWQNINTVKVAGAGSTNFVVAKDDVGNWYVKAMGSNPEAMVKAAKNLALFNMGSGFDTDLLRVDELRGKIDNTNDDTKRAEMRTELNGLTGGKSGPAVSARATTLSLFQDNYEKLSKAQLSSLASRLEADEFRIKILARWKTTLKDALTPTALDTALDAEQPKAKHQAALDAVKVDATVQPGQSILSALQALQGLRSALKATVQATTALTDSEVVAATTADKVAADARIEADRLAGLLIAAGANLQVKEAANAAAADKDSATKSQAEKERATAAADVSSLSDQLKTANTTLGAAQATAAAKQGALAAAKERQKAATVDVDTVLKGAVDEIVAQRLRTVDETEIAVKVIGQSNQ
jgi:hypothetical protein